MSNVLKTLMRGGAVAPTDEYFNQTTLLLHGDGTNGAQNNTFLDSSTNNFTITRNGNTTQGTFSPFSADEGKWSNYFDGASDYLTTPVSANLALGGSDFCIEWWEYRTSIADFEAVMGGNTSYVALYDPIIAWTSGSDVLCYLSSNNSAWNILNGFDIGTATANQWIHRALTRDGNTFRGFENGVLINTTTASGSVYMSANSWRIGQGQNQGANTFPGYISNLRMSIGSIPTDYQTSSTTPSTSIFTPSTSPLTTSSQGSTSTDVELLTCQSNRFIDNSSNGFTITPAGNVAAQPFSPFAPSAAYSPSVNGGSGYWDGSDTLTVSSSGLAFAGDFTVEAWIYSPFQGGTGASGFTIIDTRAGYTLTNWAIGIFDAAGTVYWVSTGAAPASSITCTPNAWNHVLVSRSGTTLRIFVNGQQGYSGTISGTLTPGSATAYIGTGNAGSAYTGPGYISGLSVINGTATQTSNFTPPTAPPSPTGSSLCLLMQNAGVIDSTAKNNLETVGNAQVNTSVVKYGTGSIYIPDGSSAAKTTNTELCNFGTGDFTIEGWVNPSISGQEKFFVWRGVNQANGFMIGLSTTEIRFRSNGTVDIAVNFVKSSFYHFAVVRSGSGANNVKVYVDGTQVMQGTYTNSINAGVVFVGVGGAIASQYAGTGYIDDLRITKGVARYTSAFTPPDAPFPDQ